MRLMLTLIATFVLCLNAGAAPTFLKNIEEGAEVDKLELRLGPDGSALVSTRICDQCDLITLSVNASTRAFRAGEAISLQEAASVRDSGATLIFDPETLVVKRIHFWF